MIVRILKISIPLFLLSINMFSQSFSDGPISVDVKLREVQGNFAATDESLLGIGFAPDELTFYIWAQDNLLTYPWTGGACLQDNNFTPTVGGANSIDFNTTFANFSFPGTIVPQSLDFKIDAWEDDLPSDALIGFCNSGTACTWNDTECCGIYLFGLCIGIETGDDYRCDANPFYQGLTYRSGPPCQWYSHGYINGSGCVNPSSQSGAPNTNGYYKPHIETFWRYTKGTSFATAIDLGPLTSGVLSHYNSNECYADYYPASTGNDVIYSFNVTTPTGVNISLCGLNGAQYDSYLYLVKDTTLVAMSENDDYCASQSELVTALCETGIYYVVVDATSSAELGTFTLTITEDPTSAFTNTNVVTDISCNGGNNGQINTTVLGGLTPYNYNWYTSSMSPLSTTPTSINIEDSLQNLIASDYILQITDNNNCIIIDTISVNEPAPLSFVTSQISTSCNGVSDGQVNVIVSGGTQNYSYSWNTSPVQNNANAVFLPNGTYLLTVTDANNCTDTISETVTEPLPIPVTINVPSTTVCIGSSVNLQATGAFNYSWSPPVWLNSTTSANVTSTPNSSITYVLSGTDLNGCTNTDTVDIQVVQSLMMISNPSSPEVCDGESIIINLNGASTYSWFPPNGLNNPNGSNVIASPQNTTNYMVIGTDNFGCSDTIYVNIDVLPIPNIGVTNSPSICEGESISLIANGANNYNWYPSTGLNSVTGNSVTASPVSSTSYSVIGTLNNGCSDTVSTVVSVNPNPNLSIFPPVATICEGDSIPAYVSGAVTYLWSPALGVSIPSSNTVSLSPISTTNYTILGIDNLGCSSSIFLLTNVNSLPNISISSSPISICTGDISVLNASGAISYNWQPAATLNTSIGNSVSAMPNITTIYSVNGTDVNSCSNTAATTVLVNPLPILSVSPNVTTICEGENVSINSTGAQSYIWSPALGLNTTQASSVIANPIITTFYSILGTDANGCSDIISATVNVNPKPIITLSPSSADICEGASINISSFGANSYLWDPAFGLNSTTNSSVIANPNATTNYTVLGTDFNNCTNTANFQLNVGINPTVLITPNNPIICEGGNISLTASGANQYIWKPATTLSAGVGIMVNANPSISTTYTLVGIDAIGCVDSASTTISVNPLPSAAINQNIGATICTGDSVIILVDVSGNPPWNLSYAVNGAFQQQISATNNPVLIFANVQGNYTIPTITDANGCSAIGSGSLMLNILNRPIANFDFYPQPADMLNPEITFINNSIFANSWYWDFGDGFSNIDDYSPLYAYFEEGTYQVSLVVMNDICSDTIQHILTIDPVYTLYVPEVFTPNNDGLNDIFSPQGQGVAEFDMYIYNRWGEEIFYSVDMKQGWSGKINNEAKVIAGYYSYVIHITDKLGVDHTVKGKVLLN